MRNAIAKTVSEVKEGRTEITSLIQNIGFALKTTLETNSFSSRLYADSMAQALVVHLFLSILLYSNTLFVVLTNQCHLATNSLRFLQIKHFSFIALIISPQSLIYSC